eukprot:4238604-Amphidinium_carterae.3
MLLEQSESDDKKRRLRSHLWWKTWKSRYAVGGGDASEDVLVVDQDLPLEPMFSHFKVLFGRLPTLHGLRGFVFMAPLILDGDVTMLKALALLSVSKPSPDSHHFNTRWGLIHPSTSQFSSSRFASAYIQYYCKPFPRGLRKM